MLDIVPLWVEEEVWISRLDPKFSDQIYYQLR